jgi:LDH2 family malate/lactate/ureidoglycolate dehydrogenase
MSAFRSSLTERASKYVAYRLSRGRRERRAGKLLPEGWAIDSTGQSTTDPIAALAGSLLPFGGHKGSALSTMIELLAGA